MDPCLLATYVAFSSLNIVLDPCLGNGTTLSVLGLPTTIKTTGQPDLSDPSEDSRT